VCVFGAMTGTNSSLGLPLLLGSERTRTGHDLCKVVEEALQQEEPHGSAAMKQKPGCARAWWGRAVCKLDRYFALTHRGSDFSTEFRAGTTAFLAAANNFVVNATIMQHAGVKAEDTVVSGAFCAGVACILSGLLSNLPLGLMPSIGPNVFLAFSLVATGVVGTDQALAISGACGLSLLLLSLTPVLKVVLGLVPLCIKYGLIIGTGLLSALIGLKSIGVVVPDTGPAQDIVALGELRDVRIAITSVFLIIMASMLHRGVKGAVLIGMLGATVTDWVLNGDAPDTLIALRSFKTHSLDLSILLGSFAWLQVGALLLMLLFSISGAVIGSGRMAGLLTQDGAVPGSTAVYVVCGAATMLSAACGTSPIFVSMSAAAGIRDGGRTGLTSLVVGFWCLLTAFVFSPMASAIPACAVAPVLILVGVSMVGEATEVAWWNTQEALPAFLCAVFQPFTYSVANGIYAGLGMSAVLFFTTGTFLAYLPNRRKQLADDVISATSVRDLSTRTIRAVHSQQSIVQSIAQSTGRCGSITPGVPPQRSISRGISQHTGKVGSITPGVQQDTSLPRSHKSAAHLPLSRSQTVLQQRFGFSEHDLNDMQKSHSAEELEDSVITPAFSRQGRENRLKAMRLIERAAEIVGLDAAEIQKVVEDRMLGGARSVESHLVGGIAGWEADLVHAVRSNSEMASAGVPIDADPPFVAAAARRVRFRQGTHGDLEVVQQQDSAQEQQDLESR